MSMKGATMKIVILVAIVANSFVTYALADGLMVCHAMCWSQTEIHCQRKLQDTNDVATYKNQFTRGELTAPKFATVFSDNSRPIRMLQCPGTITSGFGNSEWVPVIGFAKGKISAATPGANVGDIISIRMGGVVMDGRNAVFFPEPK